MRAAVLIEKDMPLQLKEMPTPKPEEGQVLVKIQAAALNRRDFWITKGLYPGIRFPAILGSDGCGEWNGKKVLINPNQNWGELDQVQSKNYSILGMPDHGTLAEFIAIRPEKLFEKPAHLTDEQAAALPLAGMTAFRALFTKCRPHETDKILITGIGGGVALMAAQFAIALGNEVFVTSSSQTKIDKAVSLGAKGGVIYSQENWVEELIVQSQGVDCVIDGAGGEGLSQVIKACRPGARIAIYGGTRGKIQNLSPQSLFWKQISIHGTTMSTDQEFAAMVRFVNSCKITPVVDAVFALSDAQAAIDRMADSHQFGKIVVQI